MTLLGTLCLPAQASTLAVESMAITGASYWTSVNGFPTLVNLAPGPAATLDDGMVNGVIDADGHHGSPANPVVSGVFFGMPLNGFFAHSATGPSGPTTFDPDPDAITMNLTTETMDLSADFSGFFIEWMGNTWLQGGSATGTGEWLALPLDGGPATFHFHLNWTAADTPWNLSGTAVVMMVPEPERYAMLLAGLGLVWGAARRSKQTKV
jgi:hypothetical protein